MSEYTDLIKDMRFSYSRMTTYEGCPYSFYLNYILRDKENYPPENNFYADNGSAAHETFEALLTHQIELEEAGQKYLELFKEIKTKAKESIMENTFNATFNTFINLEENWLDEKYEVVGVEERIEGVIAGVQFYGFLDVLLRDKTDGRLVIMDHKSAKPFLSKKGTVYAALKKQFEEYKKQAYLYAELVNQKYGEYPKKFIWNHFKNDCQKTEVDFDEQEFEETLTWFDDMYCRILDDENFNPKEYLTNPEVKSDEFFCNNLCNFRGSCEYIKEYRKKYWKGK